jgi:hypothetical protein
MPQTKTVAARRAEGKGVHWCLRAHKLRLSAKYYYKWSEWSSEHEREILLNN